MTTSSTRLWHPFAAMGKVDGHELVLTRGAGSRVWDAAGNEYVDATAGLWFCERRPRSRGDRRRRRRRSSALLAAHHVFGDHANEPALELARRLADLAPVEDAAVFFGTGGGEAVDTAAKIVRRYWALAGAARSERSSSRAASRTTARTRTGRRSPGSPRCATDTGRSSTTWPKSPTTTPSGARAGARRARRPRRGVPRRADDRRRRRDPAARRLLARTVERICRERDVLLDRGRGDLRLRTARPLVRMRALRLHAGPDDLREGHQLRLCPARRRGRRRARARAVLAATTRRRSSTAAPTRAIPAACVAGLVEPRHPRA